MDLSWFLSLSSSDGWASWCTLNIGYGSMVVCLDVAMLKSSDAVYVGFPHPLSCCLSLEVSLRRFRNVVWFMVSCTFIIVSYATKQRRYPQIAQNNGKGGLGSTQWQSVLSVRLNWLGCVPSTTVHLVWSTRKWSPKCHYGEALQPAWVRRRCVPSATHLRNLSVSESV